jgi:nitrite reductase/ring-hydroxylating ferredoxin subunit
MKIMGQYRTVAQLGDLKLGDCKMIEVGDEAVALYNVDGKIYASHNQCIHMGGNLGEGCLDGKYITCPLHAWKFDVTNGECDFDPEQKIQTLLVKIVGNDIQVEINF